VKHRGERVRNDLSAALGDAGKRRPLTSGMQLNAFGHVYFDN